MRRTFKFLKFLTVVTVFKSESKVRVPGAEIFSGFLFPLPLVEELQSVQSSQKLHYFGVNRRFCWSTDHLLREKLVVTGAMAGKNRDIASELESFPFGRPLIRGGDTPVGHPWAPTKFRGANF